MMNSLAFLNCNGKTLIDNVLAILLLLLLHTVTYPPHYIIKLIMILVLASQVYCLQELRSFSVVLWLSCHRVKVNGAMVVGG